MMRAFGGIRPPGHREEAGRWPSPRRSWNRDAACGSRTRVGSSSPSSSPSSSAWRAVVGGLVAFHQSLAGRILPGVSAAGVDLGGLTTDEARAALNARYGALSEGGLVLRTGLGVDHDPVRERRSRRGRRRDARRRRPRSAGAGPGSTRRSPPSASASSRQPSRSSSPTTTTCRRGRVGLRRSHDARARRRPGGPDLERLRDPLVRRRRGDRRGSRARRPSTPRCATRRPPRGRGHGPDDVRGPGADHHRGRHCPDPGAADGRGPEIAAGSKTWTIHGGRIRTWINFGWTDGSVWPDRRIVRLIPKAFGTIGSRVARPVEERRIPQGPERPDRRRDGRQRRPRARRRRDDRSDRRRPRPRGPRDEGAVDQAGHGRDPPDADDRARSRRPRR